MRYRKKTLVNKRRQGPILIGYFFAEKQSMSHLYQIVHIFVFHRCYTIRAYFIHKSIIYTFKFIKIRIFWLLRFFLVDKFYDFNFNRKNYLFAIFFLIDPLCFGPIDQIFEYNLIQLITFIS